MSMRKFTAFASAAAVAVAGFVVLPMAIAAEARLRAARGRDLHRRRYGQEKKDGEGVITEVLEPSESDPVTLDVREHDVVIEEPGDNPGDEPGDNPSPNPGDGSGSWGSSGSSSGGFLASVIGFLGNLGIIGTFLMSIFGLHAI